MIVESRGKQSASPFGPNGDRVVHLDDTRSLPWIEIQWTAGEIESLAELILVSDVNPPTEILIRAMRI